jgi:hypothetical protein
MRAYRLMLALTPPEIEAVCLVVVGQLAGKAIGF